MAQLTASRTLVKSSPELWAECSDAASLARHLGAFGEIQITKLDPETAVAWEGEDVRGTVTLEPSGWGTRVVLTAEVPTELSPEPVPESAVEPEPEPELEPEPVMVADEPEPVVVADEPVRRGFFRRLFAGWGRPPVSDSVPETVSEAPEALPVGTGPTSPAEQVTPEPAASVEAAEPAEPAEPTEPDSPSADALVGALDSLGRAHRRPFSHG